MNVIFFIEFHWNNSFFKKKFNIGNCDFEDNSKHFCKWANIGNDDFDWRRFSKRTPSGNTGPSFDHTKGDLFFYYIFQELCAL